MEENREQHIAKPEAQIRPMNKTVAKDEIKLNINTLLLFVIVILIVMSGVQVFQLQSISSALASGAVNTSVQKTAPQTQGGSVNLPSQVGGCG